MPRIEAFSNYLYSSGPMIYLLLIFRLSLRKRTSDENYGFANRSARHDDQSRIASITAFDLVMRSSTSYKSVLCFEARRFMFRGATSIPAISVSDRRLLAGAERAPQKRYSGSQAIGGSEAFVSFLGHGFH